MDNRPALTKLTDEETAQLYGYCMGKPEMYSLLRRLVTYGVQNDPPDALASKQSFSDILGRYAQHDHDCASRKEKFTPSRGYIRCSCSCGLDAVINDVVEAEWRAGETSVPQTPIVRVIVQNDRIDGAKMYTPGLPDGEHDLYCEPVGVPETTDDWIRESGWVIENGKTGDDLRYRTMEQGSVTWTADNLKAIRFARRADAEMFAEEDDGAWRIAEHIWSGPPSPVKASVPPEHAPRGASTLNPDPAASGASEPQPPLGSRAAGSDLTEEPQR